MAIKNWQRWLWQNAPLFALDCGATSFANFFWSPALSVPFHQKGRGCHPTKKRISPFNNEVENENGNEIAGILAIEHYSATLRCSLVHSSFICSRNILSANCGLPDYAVSFQDPTWWIQYRATHIRSIDHCDRHIPWCIKTWTSANQKLNMVTHNSFGNQQGIGVIDCPYHIWDRICATYDEDLSRVGPKNWHIEISVKWMDWLIYTKLGHVCSNPRCSI